MHPEYRIVKISSIKEFDLAEQFQVSHYLWGSSYCPEVTGRLAYLEGQGFALRMVCWEKNPTRVYFGADDPVYKDSCMEAFLDFKPDAPAPGYTNFEMNANGALLAGLGAQRAGRVYLRERGLRVPRPVVLVRPDFWQVDLMIPLELIRSVYGGLDFSSGTLLRGNFYKCGDETPQAHYGAWSAVGTEKPDFHQPAYFGDLVIE